MAAENETQIIQLLLKCGLFLQREMNQVCQRFGLKQQQFSVLNEIVWHGPISQNEFGETLLFEKSNISKKVRIFFQKKWIRVVVSCVPLHLPMQKIFVPNSGSQSRGILDTTSDHFNTLKWPL